jgi:hypothetical protein
MRRSPSFGGCAARMRAARHLLRDGFVADFAVGA